MVHNRLVYNARRINTQKTICVKTVQQGENTVVIKVEDRIHIVFVMLDMDGIRNHQPVQSALIHNTPKIMPVKIVQEI